MWSVWSQEHSCNAAGVFIIEFLPWVFLSKLAEVHSAPELGTVTIIVLLGQELTTGFLYQCLLRGYLPFTLLFTIVQQHEKQRILGNHEEAKKRSFTSKMHKELTPSLSLFFYCWIFLKKRTTHKQNKHTCIQALHFFPRNSRLLIASADDYISPLLRQIMAQIVT